MTKRIIAALTLILLFAIVAVSSLFFGAHSGLDDARPAAWATVQSLTKAVSE